MAIDLLGIEPGARLFDASCGIGGLMRAIAAQCNNCADALVHNVIASKVFDVCSDISSLRISFSYNLNGLNFVLVQSQATGSDSHFDLNFDFLVPQTLQVSAADALFANGKILPVQIKPILLPIPEPGSQTPYPIPGPSNPQPLVPPSAVTN